VDFEVGIDRIGLVGGLTFGQLTLTNQDIRVGDEILAILNGVTVNLLTESNFVPMG
jgi:hypothetical protein